MVTLKNNVLTVEISDLGAELQSIRKGATEYLWHGDPAYWSRRSPVLFPIVGSVWEARYRVDGKEYSLGQHGFARDMDFAVVSSSETEVRYKLESSAETLALYPYEFILDIIYRLRGNELDVIWEVTNPSSSADLHFQIGAHPAFNYPDYDPVTSGRGSFVFDRKEGLECAVLGEKGCVRAGEKYPLPYKDGVLKLEKDTFDAVNTFVLEDYQVKSVEMYKEDGTPWLSVVFDAPVLGLWSPPGENAPFVCIEPWYGRCDRMNYEGEYKDKDWMNTVAPGETFRGAYTIIIS